MDKSSIAIGLCLLALFMGPIIYLVFQQSLQNKKRHKNLMDLSSKNNMNLDELEVTNSLLLGLDTTLKRLLIVEPRRAVQHQVIKLNQINSCSVSKRSTTQHSENRANNSPSHISLELYGENLNEIVTEIVFYDEDDDQHNDADVQLVLANKWDRLIKKALST